MNHDTIKARDFAPWEPEVGYFNGKGLHLNLPEGIDESTSKRLVDRVEQAFNQMDTALRVDIGRILAKQLNHREIYEILAWLTQQVAEEVWGQAGQELTRQAEVSAATTFRAVLAGIEIAQKDETEKEKAP